jgi:hypothetical protein
MPIKGRFRETPEFEKHVGARLGELRRACMSSRALLKVEPSFGIARMGYPPAIASDWACRRAKNGRPHHIHLPVPNRWGGGAY